MANAKSSSILEIVNASEEFPSASPSLAKQLQNARLVCIRDGIEEGISAYQGIFENLSEALPEGDFLLTLSAEMELASLQLNASKHFAALKTLRSARKRATTLLGDQERLGTTILLRQCIVYFDMCALSMERGEKASNINRHLKDAVKVVNASLRDDSEKDKPLQMLLLAAMYLLGGKSEDFTRCAEEAASALDSRVRANGEDAWRSLSCFLDGMRSIYSSM